MIISEDEALEQYDEHKNVTLSDSLKEKTLRSELKGQVLRHLTKDTVVILDAQNYIKGYRYELYCASKSVKTTQVTVHCDISPPTAWTWNESRNDEKINGQKKHLMLWLCVMKLLLEQIGQGVFIILELNARRFD